MVNLNNKGGYILRDQGKKLEASTPTDEIGIRQLFDEDSRAFTYLLWDKHSEDAILVDPVVTQVNRDLLVTTTLNLVYAVNTHCHEDHISGTGILKKKVKGLRSVISKASKAKADELIRHGDEIHFGDRYITALATPGHTVGCISFLLDDGKAILTGDTLLVKGCGRTDLQGSSAETLYDSVHDILFSLPAKTVVFPGHEYGDINDERRFSSTIGEEKSKNPRLSMKKNEKEYLDAELINYPKIMDIAWPSNLRDGAKPFFVQSLRTGIKERWGIFG
eukprot:scaffold61530_cov51-Attheya_sp.AAC.2